MPPSSRLAAVVAYDGTDFHGMAANIGVRTVAGVLAAAIELVVGGPIELAVAGRTDSGVHAWGQVVTFAVPLTTDIDRMQYRLNRLLAPEVVVRSVMRVDDGFDARHSATSRRYRYQIVNLADPNPFMARTAWWVPKPLDLGAMEHASMALVGEHDFSSFCRYPKGSSSATPVSLRRRVIEAQWDPPGAEQPHGSGHEPLMFWIEANAFCHQMVRSIVGTLVDVGLGRLRAEQLPAILAAGDRAAAGRVAPPHGLCLWRVQYPNVSHLELPHDPVGP